MPCGVLKKVSTKYRKILNGATLYVVKISNPLTCSMGNSKPCHQCINWMHRFGIKKVYYSTSNGGWNCEKVDDLYSQSLNNNSYITRGEQSYKRKILK
jgi:deoxycytidylate deaminase